MSALILGCAHPTGQTTPRLVVLVVIDQFRADVLDRYEPLMSGGFRTLAVEGFRYSSASHDHAVANSAPGHATIATGRFPSRHGIVDNSWFAVGAADSILGEVEGDGDAATSIVGEARLRGISPRLRLTDGLGDWILSASPEARAGGALVVGEPSRGAPFEGGNRESFTLKNSRLTVDYLEQMAPQFATKAGRVLPVDVPAPPTIATARAGRDPESRLVCVTERFVPGAWEGRASPRYPGTYGGRVAPTEDG